MRKCIIAVFVAIAVGVFGFGGVAEASTVHVRCRTSALIAAITTANSDPGTVLKLAPGCVYRLRAPAVTGYGLPVLSSTTTVRGNGATIERKSSQQFAIMMVGFGADVTMSSLTIKGGHAPDGVFGTAGGGVLNEGTLTLEHVTVTHNRAGSTTSTLIIPVGGSGGGILNVGTLRLVRSRIVGNHAGAGPPTGMGGYGGGIYDAGQLQMTRTTIAHNFTGKPGSGGTGGLGGGLYVVLGSAPVISRSLITGNGAVGGGQGGGIYNGLATSITPVRTRIVRNRPDNCAPAGTVTPCAS